jgi:hypothetical protein
MADEPINLVKAVTSPFTGLYWIKVIMYMFGAGFLIFVGLGVYRGYFKKPSPTTTQNAAKIENYYYEPKHWGFGCATVQVRPTTNQEIRK